MPLFKFFELAESRYHCSISLSEVNKLKDVCKITDGHNGRTISLTPEVTVSSSLYNSSVGYLYKTRLTILISSFILFSLSPYTVPFTALMD